MLTFVASTSSVSPVSNSFLQSHGLNCRLYSNGRQQRYASRTTWSSPTMIRGFPNNFGNVGGGDGGNRIFDELVDFPCVFTFKIIGERQGDFMNDIVDSVASALHTDKKNFKTSFRDKGKYRSITIKAPVNTATQIYSAYAAIDRDPRVKFKF